MDQKSKALPNQKEAVLGIEFGSTRIKAVLIDRNHVPIAGGSHEWQNRLENGIWTYHLQDVWDGLQDSYRQLKADYEQRYGETLHTVGAIGFSGMMHGYLAFDRNGELLVPFRTWRNTTTAQAAAELTELFEFHIPQRWSIAHLYQAILNDEPHVGQIDFLTTLAGYVHWKLTGKRVLGAGEASGMFPLDSKTGSYDRKMLAKFESRIASRGYRWDLTDLMPEICPVGENAGLLTEEGARLLDPSGDLEAGIPLCPPEGDAGTGMAATNAVAPRTGNVSAGTSIFAMIVLEEPLSGLYPEIDLVTTPEGRPVAMVHCNNCTSDVNAWAALLREFSEAAGMPIDNSELYRLLFQKALEGQTDCGGVLCCGYLSGEPIAGLDEGRPLVVRRPDAELTLGNFMRAQLYATVATLKIGMDLLFQKENVQLDRLMGHGGLFRTPVVGQKVMAAATGVPVSVMETAGEGGAWGMALLGAYMLYRTREQTLSDYLCDCVFREMVSATIEPEPEDVKGFSAYMEQYRALLPVEAAAAKAI